MNIFVQLFKTTIFEYSVYRVNFLLWRFRVVLNFLIIFSLWKGVSIGNNLLFGYSSNEIQTYIFVSFFLTSVVMSTRLPELAGEIINGTIISRLVQPLCVFYNYLVRDLADKTINILCAFVELIILYMLFKPDITLRPNITTVFFFIIYLSMGIALSFSINVLISCIGFLSNDVWAPRFIYFILITFLSGSYFPLDIVPSPLYNLLLLTPFPYLFFIPSKIIIQGFGLTVAQTPLISIIPVFWVVLLIYAVRFFWGLGMRSYSFFGK